MLDVKERCEAGSQLVQDVGVIKERVAWHEGDPAQKREDVLDETLGVTRLGG
jgi:hypothetical protein